MSDAKYAFCTIASSACTTGFVAGFETPSNAQSVVAGVAVGFALLAIRECLRPSDDSPRRSISRRHESF